MDLIQLATWCSGEVKDRGNYGLISGQISTCNKGVMMSINKETHVSNVPYLEHSCGFWALLKAILCEAHYVKVNKVPWSIIGRVREPSLLTCSTCKSVYSSSWFLIQHVQKQHKLGIYVDSTLSALKSPTEKTDENLSDKNNDVTKPLDTSSKVASLSSSSSSSSSTKLDQSPSLGNQARLSSQTSPLIGQPHLFSPPNSSLISPHPRPPTNPLLSWHPFTRPPLNTDLITLPPDYLSQRDLTEQLRRFAGNLPPFRANSILEAYPDYSSRLRQLAANPAVTEATTTTPSSPTASSPLSSTKKISLPSPDAPSAFSPPSSSKAKAAVSPLAGVTERKGNQTADAHVQLDSGRKCDSCDKFFKYGSNLIVHKRVHTGERPYKCPHCSRGYMQACTLRKHLVQRHKASALQLLSTAQHGAQDDDGESDEEEEVDDSQTFALREAQCQAELIMYAKEHLKLTSTGETGDAPSSEWSHAGSQFRATSTLSKPNAISLMTDFMQKTGLGHLEQYQEAFREALKESQRTESEAGDGAQDQSAHSEATGTKARSSTSDDLEESVDCESRDSTPPMRRQSTPSRDSTDDGSPSKKLKLDTSASQPSTPSALFPSPLDLYKREMAAVQAASIYPIWFPPPVTLPTAGDYFPITPQPGAIFTAPSLTPSSRSQENNMNSQSSALFIPSPSKTPVSTIVITPITSTTQTTTQSSTSPGGGGGGGSGGNNQGIRRRNDTCEYCGKIFKNCSNLTVHRRSHTGEKPYKCSLCNYACAQSSKLTRHMRTHCRLGKDVYRCKFCDMPFSVPSTLEKHMRKCMELKPNNNATGSATSASKSSKTLANRNSTSGLHFSSFKLDKKSPSDPFSSSFNGTAASLPANINGSVDRLDSSGIGIFPGIDLRKSASSSAVEDDGLATTPTDAMKPSLMNGPISDPTGNIFLSGIDLSTSRPSSGSTSSSPKLNEAASSPADLASLRFNHDDTQKSRDSMDTPLSKITNGLPNTQESDGEPPAITIYGGMDLSTPTVKPSGDAVSPASKRAKLNDAIMTSQNEDSAATRLSKLTSGKDLSLPPTNVVTSQNGPGSPLSLSASKSDERLDGLASKCSLNSASPTNSVAIGTV